ncbi:MAG: hydroxyquinol 1,2-dioxygenase [Tabrizicola sp.]|nr:hydroxyquinol 1,2-dioxygenase [Tabrizicola sp.]
MGKVTINNVTDVVIGSLGQNGQITDRQREIMTAAIRHLHGFCKDVNLTHAEFIEACMFLGRAGAICSDKRQEFILLGDILGVEVLCDMLTNPVTGSESESTVLGTFYRENPPVLPHGASNHDHDQPDYNLRGRFETDENGYFALRALRPVPYPIPADETAGELLRYMGHHPNRPGHLHFIVAKDGYRTLVSQVYDCSSAYLDNDSVFAVKDSLVGNFQKGKPEHGTDLYLRFDFTLKPEAAASALAAE